MMALNTHFLMFLYFASLCLAFLLCSILQRPQVHLKLKPYNDLASVNSLHGMHFEIFFLYLLSSLLTIVTVLLHLDGHLHEIRFYLELLHNGCNLHGGDLTHLKLELCGSRLTIPTQILADRHPISALMNIIGLVTNSLSRTFKFPFFLFCDRASSRNLPVYSRMGNWQGPCS